MIRLNGVRKSFRQNDQELVVFDDLNIVFEEGKVTAVLGPSGCGKTTLLRMVAGLESPSGGSIVFDTPDQRVGMVFQEYTAFPWRTVEENIRFGLEEMSVQQHEQNEVVDYWLVRTELMRFRDFYPSQISGGMKQRLALARALAVKPNVLLLDEPFGALDTLTREKLATFTQELLASLHITVLFVTHSIREAILFADSIYALSKSPSIVKEHILLEIPHPREYEALWSMTARRIEDQLRSSLSSS